VPDGAAQRRRREHAGTLHRVVVLEDGFAWEGRSTVFPGMPMHYLSKRYVLRGGKPMLFAVGVHGQNLFVDRQNEIPIARSGGPDYVPPAQRIAAFNNDGTLWAEPADSFPGPVCNRPGAGLEEGVRIRAGAKQANECATATIRSANGSDALAALHGRAPNRQTNATSRAKWNDVS
jgi:hypothetical protein